MKKNPAVVEFSLKLETKKLKLIWNYFDKPTRSGVPSLHLQFISNAVVKIRLNLTTQQDWVMKPTINVLCQTLFL